MRVGAAWSTSFARTGLDRLRYRRLRYAYRAPSFFMQGMLGAGFEVGMIDFDEEFHASHLVAGHVGNLAILYVSTHGMHSSRGFELALHAGDWTLASSGFGTNGPIIAVFDACDLVDLSDSNWELDWRRAGLGSTLRLVLGFSSPAAVGERSSMRGVAFVHELLAGNPVAGAWCAAIQNASYAGTDKAIAIALGDDAADADAVLYSASLSNLPAGRTASVPCIAWMQ